MATVEAGRGKKGKNLSADEERALCRSFLAMEEKSQMAPSSDALTHCHKATIGTMLKACQPRMNTFR